MVNPSKPPAPAWALRKHPANTNSPARQGLRAIAVPGPQRLTTALEIGTGTNPYPSTQLSSELFQGRGPRDLRPRGRREASASVLSQLCPDGPRLQGAKERRCRTRILVHHRQAPHGLSGPGVGRCSAKRLVDVLVPTLAVGPERDTHVAVTHLAADQGERDPARQRRGGVPVP